MLNQVAPPAPPVSGGLFPFSPGFDLPRILAGLCLLSGRLVLFWGLRNLETRNRKVVLIHLGLCPLPVVVTILGCGPILLGMSGGGTSRASSVLFAIGGGVAGTLLGFLSALLAAVQLRRIDSTE